MSKVFISRDDYRTYYQYRKTIKGYRDGGWIVRNACGGVWCFESAADYLAASERKMKNLSRGY